jgi:hypothetical protein
MRDPKRHTVSFLYRPGLSWPEERLARLSAELREVASTCFDPMPVYQCLTGTREELSRNVITVARDVSGQMEAFSSTVLLEVEGVGTVLHLGLTCVRPTARSQGLTHRLLLRLLFRYLLHRGLLRGTWVTNVSCVLNTLGSVGMFFEDVYPSSAGPAAPSRTHRLIAQAVDTHYREPIYISRESEFDWETFVFRRCSRTTVFRKRADDTRFHHREPDINAFYSRLLNFEDGDELLQVGRWGVLSLPRYFLRQRQRKAATRDPKHFRTTPSLQETRP